MARCRAAMSESLLCDLTGPADTPGLGPGPPGLRNVARSMDTLHFILSAHSSPGSQEVVLPLRSLKVQFSQDSSYSLFLLLSFQGFPTPEGSDVRFSMLD